MKTLPGLFRNSDVWSPTRELSALHRGIDRLFDDFMSPVAARSDTSQLGGFNPAVDIEETDSKYVMSFDLPGVRSEDVRIELADNQLLVTGERKDERKEDKKARHYVERFYGQFTRSFTLPQDVDPEKIEANFENGVLMVSIPKAEKTKARQIQIGKSKAA